MNRRELLLVRHPEAEKNVEDRHGGKGSPLTKVGLAQCNAIAQHILGKSSALDRCKLIGHNVTQVRQTADVLGRLLGLTPVWDEKLEGIDLGVLAGLSRNEALRQYPSAAERLELWRTRRLPMNQLKIPNMEAPSDFKRRVETVLDEWLAMQDVELIAAICTRSTIIMFINLIRLANEFDFDRYRPYDLDPGSITIVEVLHSHARVVAVNYLGHLPDGITRQD